MIAKHIISLQHPIIKYLVKLKNNKKFRKQENQVLILGDKIVNDVCKSIIPTMLITTKKDLDNTFNCENIISVHENVMRKIYEMPTAEGLAAVVPMPKEVDIKDKKRILLLDKISDPGNFGTLIRSALAFNFEAVILSELSVDPYNDKALRAAKGSTFFIPINNYSQKDIISLLSKQQFNIYIADTEGKGINDLKFKEPLILVLGNESHGISLDIDKKPFQITIPISENIDSLNVAIAGSICMHEINK